MSEEEDIIRGYEAGADDYMIKPFHLSELYMKAKVWISRNSKLEGDENISEAGIVLKLKERSCQLDGISVGLTFIEFELLKLLMQNKGIVISRESFLSILWPEKLDINDRAIDSHIKNLRKKLGKYGQHIKSIRGIGYSFKV